MSTIPTLPRPITRKLDELRRAVAMWFIVDGISWLLVSAIAWVFGSLVIDYLFRMDTSQRFIMLLILAAGLATVFYRRLMLPMSRRLSADDLAIRVERKHPELADGLISALQFARMDDPTATGASAELIGRAIADGAAAAEPVRFDAVLNRKAYFRNLRTAGLAVAALVLAIVLLPPGVMSLWAARNLALSDRAWPQDTELIVEHAGFRDGVLTLPRGDDLNLRVRAVVKQGADMPELVYLDHRAAAGRGGKQTEQMIAVGDDAFRFTFPNVLDELRFRVRGGDATSPWYAVRLVERPGLLPTDEQSGRRGLNLFVDPPAYTKLDRTELAPGEGAYRVLHGSTLVVEGYATKPLSSATLSMPLPAPTDQRSGSRAPARQTLAMAVEPADEQRVTRVRDDGETVTETFPAGPRRFTLTVPAERFGSGGFALTLVDTDGLSTRRPIRFSVKVHEDEAPSVRAQLRGIGDLVTEKAVVPVAMRLSDDFAVESVALSFRFTRLGGDEQGGSETLPVAVPDGQLGSAEIEPFVHEFEIEPLSIWLGSILTFTIEATDNDAVTGPKAGRSSAFSVKVVTEEELRNELLRREQEQRVEFERMLKDQRALEVDTRALRAGLTDDGKLTREQVKALGEVEKKQRLVAGRCESIAERFTQIRAEVINNRIEEASGPVQRRLTRRIIDPLRYLAIDVVPVAADAVDAARRPSLAHADRVAQMDRALQTQANAIEQMTLILRNMVKLEGYQEAVNLLREIIKSQKDLNEQTIKELEKRIEGIFDD